MPEALSITKPNTVETFMKANTDLRIGADALKEFQKQLDTLALSITKEAARQAQASDRTTIMSADIKSAMTAVTGSTSDLPYLFRQLEKLTAKETADLSTLIQKWIAAH
jgi:histone H3/H4